MLDTAQANGERGALAVCSTHDAARAAAAAAEACGPTHLAMHLGVDNGLGVVRATGDGDALAAAMGPHANTALHLTAERALLRHRRTWELGEPTPGITMLFSTRARSGLSADDYHRYWEREHGPRALRHHLGMWDYTQVSVTRTLYGEHVDGFAVTQWPCDEDLAQRFTDGPAGRAVIEQDAARFTDLRILERQRVDSRTLVDAPWPTTGTVEITDARHLELDRCADDIWRVIGRFDALPSWWPGGFVGCTASSERGIGMTRTLSREDGSSVVERLIELRPDERMLQLVVDEGMETPFASYTCRYEIRPLGEARCRLDWYPRAVMHADGIAAFGALVDRSWPIIAAGLVQHAVD